MTADRTAVGYVCLWEGTSSGSKFLHLFDSCYHMFGRSSEVSLSRFSDIKMETVKDNSGCYNAAIQVIKNPRPVPIRSYVSILRENLLSTAGTGPWHTPVPYTIMTTSISFPSSLKLSSIFVVNQS